MNEEGGEREKWEKGEGKRIVRIRQRRLGNLLRLLLPLRFVLEVLES